MKLKYESIEVKESVVHGNGVFALRDFKKGETVIEWDTSHRVSKEKYNTLSEYDKARAAFLDGEYIIMQSPAKYVNHSCESNVRSGGGKEIAVRDIKIGEEIFGNYSNDMAPGECMVCTCGSLNCKGKVCGI